MVESLPSKQVVAGSSPVSRSTATILAAVKLPKYANTIAAAFIILLALVLILFTFHSPHLPIFLDANTGTYGIPR